MHSMPRLLFFFLRLCTETVLVCHPIAHLGHRPGGKAKPARMLKLLVTPAAHVERSQLDPIVPSAPHRDHCEPRPPQT